MKIIIGLLFSCASAAVTLWSLFSSPFSHNHPIITYIICLYGCVITPGFILLGESIIEDGVKLVMMFGLGAALWHFLSWQVALPFFVPPICGLLANQIIKAISIKRESVNKMPDHHSIDPGR